MFLICEYIRSMMNLWRPLKGNTNKWRDCLRVCMVVCLTWAAKGLKQEPHNMAIDLESNLDNAVAFVGQSAKLNCKTQDSGQHQNYVLSWFFNKDLILYVRNGNITFPPEINPNTRYKALEDYHGNHCLEVTNVTREDAGVYTCRGMVISEDDSYAEECRDYTFTQVTGIADLVVLEDVTFIQVGVDQVVCNVTYYGAWIPTLNVSTDSALCKNQSGDSRCPGFSATSCTTHEDELNNLFCSVSFDLALNQDLKTRRQTTAHRSSELPEVSDSQEPVRLTTTTTSSTTTTTTRPTTTTTQNQQPTTTTTTTQPTTTTTTTQPTSTTTTTASSTTTSTTQPTTTTPTATTTTTTLEPGITVITRSAETSTPTESASTEFITASASLEIPTTSDDKPTSFTADITRGITDYVTQDPGKGRGEDTLGGMPLWAILIIILLILVLISTTTLILVILCKRTTIVAPNQFPPSANQLDEMPGNGDENESELVDNVAYLNKTSDVHTPPRKYGHISIDLGTPSGDYAGIKTTPLPPIPELNLDPRDSGDHESQNSASGSVATSDVSSVPGYGSFNGAAAAADSGNLEDYMLPGAGASARSSIYGDYGEYLAMDRPPSAEETPSPARTSPVRATSSVASSDRATPPTAKSSAVTPPTEVVKRQKTCQLLPSFPTQVPPMAPGETYKDLSACAPEEDHGAVSHLPPAPAPPPIPANLTPTRREAPAPGSPSKQGGTVRDNTTAGNTTEETRLPCKEVMDHHRLIAEAAARIVNRTGDAATSEGSTGETTKKKPANKKIVKKGPRRL